MPVVKRSMAPSASREVGRVEEVILARHLDQLDVDAVGSEQAIRLVAPPRWARCDRRHGGGSRTGHSTRWSTPRASISPARSTRTPIASRLAALRSYRSCQRRNSTSPTSDGANRSTVIDSDVPQPATKAPTSRAPAAAPPDRPPRPHAARATRPSTRGSRPAPVRGRSPRTSASSDRPRRCPSDTLVEAGVVEHAPTARRPVRRAAGCRGCDSTCPSPACRTAGSGRTSRTPRTSAGSPATPMPSRCSGPSGAPTRSSRRRRRRIGTRSTNRRA